MHFGLTKSAQKSVRRLWECCPPQCCHPQFYHPGSEGPIVYFAASEDTPALLERATAAGGEVLIPWRMISLEQGSMALFKDCEGNRVGVRG